MINTLATIETPVDLSPLPEGTSPADKYLSRLGARSVRVVRSDLNRIAGILSTGACDAFSLPWWAVTHDALETAAQRLVESGLAPATIRRMLSSARGVLRKDWDMGLMTSEEFGRATVKIPVKGERLPAGRAIGPGELSALAAGCKADTSPAGRRDAALFTLAYAGLRRAEIVALDLEHLDRDTGALKVLGKGGKERLVYVADGRPRAAIDEWLEVRGLEPGPLLQRVRKGGRIAPARLTDQAIYDVLARRAAAAGIAGVSPHDFRRTFAGDLLERGADISTVQKLMGHSSVTTTQRYDRRPESAKRKAVSLLHSPF